MNFKYLIIFINLLELRNCLICSYCNRCSFNDQDSSQTCNEPNSSCFSGKQNGFIYQGCTTQSHSQLRTTYINVEVCSSNFCNRNVQLNSGSSLTCYSCMGCDITNANRFTQICRDSSHKCYSGSRSNMIYQGCTTSSSSTLSTTYLNARVCSSSFCNSYSASDFRGISCYSCQGCSKEFSGNIQQTCQDNTYNCYIGMAVGRIYQGCTKESYSSLSSRMRNVVICSGSLCNSNNLVSMGPTCYECQGCMDNAANIRTQSCSDPSYRCFSGTKLGFTYQGCTQWSDTILKQNYKHLKVCSENLCNKFYINISLSLGNSRYFIGLLCFVVFYFIF